MAVTHKLYGPFMKNLSESTGVLANSLGSTALEIKVVIMTSEHVFNQDHEYWSQISTDEQSTSTTGNEDYVKGGQLLNGKDLSYAARITTVTASSYTSFTTGGDIIGYYAVLAASSYLMSCVDFDGQEKSVAGEFKINWTDAKIMTMEVSV